MKPFLSFKQFINRRPPEKTYEGPDRRVGPRRTKSTDSNVPPWPGRRKDDAIGEAKKDPCWDRYKMLGMKKKGNEEVPNCIPEAAVDAKGYKSSTGGLTQKGRNAYNADGGNLQAPVTTPPSKLDPDSKAAKRRKSFCARMGGVDGPMKKPNGEPTRKALALRKWNC